MKLYFNLEKAEAGLEADVEKLVEKGMDQKEKLPPKKTRYQIKQEEKRKTMELEHKQEMQKVFFGVGIVAICLIVAITMAILGNMGILS